MKGRRRIDTDFFGYAEKTRKDGATKESAIFPFPSLFFIDRKIIGRFNELYIRRRDFANYYSFYKENAYYSLRGDGDFCIFDKRTQLSQIIDKIVIKTL